MKNAEKIIVALESKGFKVENHELFLIASRTLENGRFDCLFVDIKYSFLKGTMKYKITNYNSNNYDDDPKKKVILRQGDLNKVIKRIDEQFA